MVFMYATNAMLHGWWENVTIIIWGATAKLATENPIIQERIKLAQHAGVFFTACIACANQLGVTEKLKEMGVEVKGWGQPLTELIKEGENLITI
jgi:hypothetical protein